jgi:formylglycine-generating enzyme required for sulfatase activity
MARYPVTNAMFARFIEDGGYQDARWWSEANAAGVWREGRAKDWSGDVRNKPAYWKDERFNGPNQPVVGVTWYEAAAYCRWLTAAMDDAYEYRLPTEAEWERAARGVEGRRYPWGDQWRLEQANSKELGLERTTPVGVFPDGASPEGLLDMTGNVWEWCGDWYAEDTYARRVGHAVSNPAGPAKGEYKILRGGSWYNDHNVVRCAFRFWIAPDRWFNFSGFRVARGSLRKVP